MTATRQTDYVVVRNSSGAAGGALDWLISLSGGGTRTVTHGISTDRTLARDFDGDGKCDPAIWRVGQFQILESSTNTVRTVTLGQDGDDPTVSDDYDGDGKADPAVVRKTPVTYESDWFILGSRNNPGGTVTQTHLPLVGAFPAPEDYDGDGRTDPCMQGSLTSYNPSGRAVFHVLRSSDGTASQLYHGNTTDRTVAGDYDGDGKSDYGALANSAGLLLWKILIFTPDGPQVTNVTLGLSSTDFPAPGDYDGDGKLDPAAWTPATGVFKVRRSSDGVTSSFTWGKNGDYPLANGYIH